MRAVLCSHNAHKVVELQALLPQLRLTALSADQQLPPETGTTFLANAQIKARAGAALHPGAWAIADDSGLEVDALNGEPGVFSARFAGDGCSDGDNNTLLLERLAGVPDDQRGARFVCVLVAIAPDGSELSVRGEVEGRIAHELRGSNGFGYDPLFVPVGESASFGVLSAQAKASMSHRANAARSLAEQLAAAVHA